MKTHQHFQFRFGLKSGVLGLAVLLWVSNPGFSQREILHRFDVSEMSRALLSAPNEVSQEAKSRPFSYALPLPDGTMETFHFERYELMAPEFAAQYPDFFTYKIKSVDNPRFRGRATITPFGLMVTIFTPDKLVEIAPLDLMNPITHRILERDYDPGNFPCGTDENMDSGRILEIEKSVFTNGATLKTYSLAIVTTGEFGIYHGGTVPSASAVVVSQVAALEGLYEEELAVNFSLLTPAIYTDPTTDPFEDTNTNRVLMAADAIALNWPNSNEYDLGHCLHTGYYGSGAGPVDWSGGVALIASVCNNNLINGNNNGGRIKGGAWSTVGFSVGGNISLFAHEVGHQFNMRHTFNGIGGNCTTNNISLSSAVEIGSGTTIMSYNGLCGAGQNVPSFGISDLYFHIWSLTEAVSFINANTCQNSTISSGNTPPVINANPCGGTVSIPKSTPFRLSGSGTDADNDYIIYTWEQVDEDGNGVSTTQGFIGATAGASPVAPLFRSYPPQNSSYGYPIIGKERFFPDMALVAANNYSSAFEPLPTVPRVIKMVLTGRDSNGGVGSSNLDLFVQNIGPFSVTFPNGGGSFATGSSISVSWNIAGGGLQSSCNSINIWLSVDGGLTFPHLIVSGTPNDGTQTVNIPYSPFLDLNISPYQNIFSECRIMVECADNPCATFFDISNSNFTISRCSPPDTEVSPVTATDLPQGDPGLINLGMTNNIGSIVNSISGTITTSDPSGNTVFLDAGVCTQLGSMVKYDVFTVVPNVSGSYTFTLSGTGGLYLNLYQTQFSGLNCTNHIASSATRPSGTGSIGVSQMFTAFLTAGTIYYLTVSPFSSSTSLPANYTINFTEPLGSAIYNGPILLPGYGYTFLAVNSSNDLVAAVNPSSNFSSLPVGNYCIYGAAYNSSSPSSWVGLSLSDIISNGVCASFSSNCRPVTICSPPAVNAGVDINTCPGVGSILTGSVTGAATTGTWTASVPGGTFLPNANTLNATYLPPNNGPSTIILTLTATGACPASDQMTINYTDPEVIAGSYGPLCSTATPISLVGSPAGGTWTGTGVSGNTTTGFTFNPGDGTQALTYTATNNSNGCVGSSTTTIVVITPPTVGLTKSGDISCANPTVTLLASPTTGVTYSWSSGATPIAGTNTATVSAAGNYSVTVTSAPGCSATASESVTSDNQAPTAQLAKSEDLSCAVTSVTLTASPATNVTYAWGNGATGIPGTNMATVSAAGTYTVTVTAANGCSSTANVEVTADIQAPMAGLTKSGNLSCAITSVTLTATPATDVTYAWNAGATPVTGSNTATVSAAGTYTVTVTAANGCSSTANVEVTADIQAPMAGLTKSGNLTCTVTSVTLTATPATGVTYVWSTGATAVPGSNTATVNSAGTYTVTVTAPNGCTDSESITVSSDSQAPAAALTKSGDLSCAITSVTLTATPATDVTYAWSAGATPVSGSNSATVSAAGTYTVTVTNMNGCIATANVQVTADIQAPNVILVKSGDFSCAVSLITLTAFPNIGMTYSWSAGAIPINATNSATVTSAGTYSVNVTNLGNGCSASQSVTVNPAPALPIINTVLITHPTCAQPSGTLQINATAGSALEYSVNGGLNYQSGSVLTGLTPGNYEVLVRLFSDQACVTTYTLNPVVILPVPVAPMVNSVTTIQPTCIQLTGTIAINASGSSPLVYSMNNGLGFQTSNEFSGLTPGSYQIMVALQSDLTCTQLYVNNPVVLVEAQNCCTAPTVTCIPQTITFNGQSSITLDPENMVTISGNSCDIASITATPSVITCQQIGQIVPVVITVTDIEQNVSTCIALVTVGGLPCGWSFNENGLGCANGSTNFEFFPGSGTIIGTSTNCYSGPPFNADASAFAQRALCGNGSITVRVANVNPIGGGWAGIVMRESAAPDAHKVQISTNLISHRGEIRSGSGYNNILRSANNRRWLRITRLGNNFTISTSTNGMNWVFFSAHNIPMPACILVGVTLSNFNPGSTVTATYTNLSFTGNISPLLANPSEQPISEEVPSLPEFSVFPNPGSGLFTLDLSAYLGKKIRYEVQGLQGQVLYSGNIDEVQIPSLEIDFTEQKKGIYFIRIKSEGVLDSVRRVIIQ